MTIPQFIIDFNRKLCESSDRLPVRETLAGPSVPMPGGKQEGAGSSKGAWLAKISHADRINQNRRVYSRELWNQTISLIKKPREGGKSDLESGKVIGAMDHASYFAGGNLGDTCVIWRDIWMDSDGSVWGRYDILDGTSKGGDLKAMKDAGVAIGWSTSGYGSAHDPGETEIEKYGDGNGWFVVMDLNYELKKVDAVDDPSCHDAWDTAESQTGQSRLSEHNRPVTPQRNPIMKTFADLEKLHPELAGTIKSENATAIQSAVAVATKPLTEQINGLTAKVQQLETDLTAKTAEAKVAVGAISALIVSAKEISGVDLPQREVLPAETATRIDQLEKSVEAEKKKAEKAEADKVAVEKQLADIAAEKADAERKKKASDKLESLLTGNAFAAGIRKAFEKASLAKDFDEAKVEAFVKETVELFEAAGVKPEGGPSRKGTVGIPASQRQENSADGQDESPDELSAFAG